MTEKDFLRRIKMSEDEMTALLRAEGTRQLIERLLACTDSRHPPGLHKQREIDFFLAELGIAFDIFHNREFL